MSQQPSSLGEFASVAQALDQLQDDQHRGELATMLLDVVESQLAEWARRYEGLGTDLSQHIAAHAHFCALWGAKRLLRELEGRRIPPQVFEESATSLAEELRRLTEDET
jgi:hypothetical protein